MAFHREEPPSPSLPTPSVALLRAIGFLQDAREGDDVFDEELDMIAWEAKIAEEELWPLIHAGIRAGYLLMAGYNAICLSPKGWAWYRHDAER